MVKSYIKRQLIQRINNETYDPSRMTITNNGDTSMMIMMEKAHSKQLNIN